MSMADIETTCAEHGLFVMGTLEHDDLNLALIGANATFWNHFQTSAEFLDGAKDPIDRYSKRHVIAMAQGGRTFFPSDGPPYHPFIAWALKSGRFWQSPTGMMVHDTAGLMISIRGAVELQGKLPDTSPQASPCDTCADRPCITACPVEALNAHSLYDVLKCKEYLNTASGAECMERGCAVRRICPVSQSFDRPEAQSAFHMKAFNPKK